MLLNKLRTVAKQVAETIGSVAGIRVWTEEPLYTVEPLIEGVQIRRYGSRTAAQTAVAAGEEVARSEGFRRLARYIFGANHAREKIAMTAPVGQQATTARVELVAVPPETVAVLRFSGNRGRTQVAARTAELRELLRVTGFEAVGDATAWFYDPPWTLPFRRRNEIAIPVSESASEPGAD